jgi:S1-C subfamily serine protease
MARAGVVTASHVLAACPPNAPAAPFQVGAGSGTVSTNDRSHDLALLTYLGTADPNRGPGPKPLQPESRPAYIGEPLALLGIPARPLLGSPFTLEVTVVPGTVVAVNHSQVLTSPDGGRETLTDAIEVACQGVSSGESGGPAVDRAGKVVGVIEGGSGSGITTLTPVTDLMFLH